MTFAIDELLDLWQQTWTPGPAAEDAFRRFYTDPVTLNGASATVATLVDRSITLNQALTDQQRQVDQVVQTDQEVAVAFRLSGRHVGPLTTRGGILPATGRRLELSIIDILTLIDGRVSAIRMVADELAALVAINAVTLWAPGSAPPCPADGSPMDAATNPSGWTQSRQKPRPTCGSGSPALVERGGHWSAMGGLVIRR